MSSHLLRSKAMISEGETYLIRPEQDSDIPYLPIIEKSAGQSFAALADTDPQVAELAKDDPMPIDHHQSLLGLWRARTGLVGNFVATTSTSEVVGFIVTSIHATLLVPGRHEVDFPSGKSEWRYLIHIEELSVHADHQRRGIAAKLLGAVQSCARSLADSNIRDCGDGLFIKVMAVTLTTMKDVSFNAPFYAKHGFEVLTHWREVDEKFGANPTANIWEEDLEHFRDIGDGSLESRRCFMYWRVPKA